MDGKNHFMTFKTPSGWLVRTIDSNRVIAMARTRRDIEMIARIVAREGEGYLSLRSATGKFYDNVDYREDN